MNRTVRHVLMGLACTAVLLTGILPFHASAAEETIPVDAAHFPDAAFREFITSAEFNFAEGVYTAEEGNFCIDRNHDGQLSKAEREAVACLILGKDDPTGSEGQASVDTSRYPIADLTGIDYFPNLTYLQIGGPFGADQTEYSSFLSGTVDLLGNHKLKTVILANGSVSGVDVAHTLDRLDLHGNRAEEVDPEQGEAGPVVQHYSVGESKRLGHPIVCLDAGHYGKYNQSWAVPAYYESDMSWKFHLMLKEELEQYGIEVRITRESQDLPRVIVERGQASAGCDLFVSIHSNASDSGYVDRPEAICFVPRDDSGLDELSADIADRLGQTVYDVMATRQTHQTYYRFGADDRDGNGKYDDNYYGVLHGAFSVGTPGLILEHSYHTNAAAANWLLQDANLRKLAVAEAKTIADWFQERMPDPEWVQDENGWRYEYPDGTAFTDQWAQISGFWYHFDTQGYMQTGWQLIGGHWFYLDGSGHMQTGWQQIGSNRFYLDGSGHMVTGWQLISGSRYYFNSLGHMQTGWQEIGTKTYYFYEDGTMAVSTIIDGKYINSSGIWVEHPELLGWQSDDKGRWYVDDNGERVIGWYEIDGFWYHFDAQGYMQTGWQEVNGFRVYLDEDGHMQTGWLLLDGNWYYLDGNGHMVTGWRQVGDSWYYLDENGHALMGWQEIHGFRFYLDQFGRMMTGWQLIDGDWYYLDSNGHMVTGWQQVNGHWYYLDSNGHMVTGWQQVGGAWYYLDQYGHMTTGWRWIDGKCYYFYDSGAMASNTWIDGSYVNGSGVWVQ